MLERSDSEANPVRLMAWKNIMTVSKDNEMAEGVPSLDFCKNGDSAPTARISDRLRMGIVTLSLREDVYTLSPPWPSSDM